MTSLGIGADEFEQSGATGEAARRAETLDTITAAVGAGMGQMVAHGCCGTGRSSPTACQAAGIVEGACRLRVLGVWRPGSAVRDRTVRSSWTFHT